MSEELKRFRAMVHAGLVHDQKLTKEKIREWVEKVRLIISSVTDGQAEYVADELEKVHGVTMRIGSKLEGRCSFEKWLDAARVDIEPYYWNRYKGLLEKKKLSRQVITTMDQITDRILGLIENPVKKGPWNRRGMVVGHVQSGKTANYIGLINKAADAGYRVIVVIAGVQERLRIQTQIRIDEGFLMFDSINMLHDISNSDYAVDVSGSSFQERRPATFTTVTNDFDRQIAVNVGVRLNNLRVPVVFVIKKNASILGNLIEWLKEHNAQQRGTSSIAETMLLIDDEADNASINTRANREEVSRINGQIRQLLNIFDRSSYVGYTATPFANIFIDPDTEDEMFEADLFPRDFIVSLDPPDNYFGASRVFLSGPDEDKETDSTIVRHIRDNEDILPLKHKKEHEIRLLPDSLGDAIRTFIVARAIRLVREYEKDHNSMLVNMSRFNNIQEQLKDEIYTLVKNIENNIRVNADKVLKEAVLDPEISALKDVFDREYCNTGVSWEEVQRKLLDSISAIEIKAINLPSSDNLNYDEHPSGLNVIAVGGFSLSRGLTLEGLVVSYFLRSSRMYDTLMQMGRWFGYRYGYEDLCRVWMSEEVEGLYAHIAESIEELRYELRCMEAAGATPQQFGLKVRSHPDIIVTARNKMGAGQKRIFSISLANRLVETTALYKDEGTNKRNHLAVANLAKGLQKAGLKPEDAKIGGGKFFEQVSVKNVLNFLMVFKNHPEAIKTNTDAVCQYIRDREDTELSTWDVLFAGKSNDNGKTPVDKSLGFKIICQRRKEGNNDNNKKDFLWLGDSQRVASRGIEAIGLSETEKNEAEKEYCEENSHKLESGKSINYPDFAYRKKRKRPLLIIHLLTIGEEKDNLKDVKPVVAYGISFPQTEYDEKKASYVVNLPWRRGRRGKGVDESKEIDGDD